MGKNPDGEEGEVDAMPHDVNVNMHDGRDFVKVGAEKEWGRVGFWQGIGIALAHGKSLKIKIY